MDPCYASPWTSHRASSFFFDKSGRCLLTPYGEEVRLSLAVHIALQGLQRVLGVGPWSGDVPRDRRGSPQPVPDGLWYQATLRLGPYNGRVLLMGVS